AAPRRGVAGAVVDQVEPRIVRAEAPGDRAAQLPRIALPRVVPRLAGAWHRPRAPRLLPRVLAVGDDVAARAEFPAGEAGDHQVLGDGGRGVEDRALRVVDDLRLPQFLAVLRVQGDQVAVEAPHEQLAVRVGDAAVVDVAARELLDARG